MSFLYNTVCNCESSPSYSTFVPCCNTSISVDYQAQHFQEVYYAAEPPPQIQVVRQRLPDPPADVIERLVVVPQPKQYVYQVVEVPTKPPPIIQERIVHESPNAPVCGGTYHVQVPHRQTPQPTRMVRSSSTVMKSPSYAQASPSTGAQQTRVVYSSSPPPPIISM